MAVERLVLVHQNPAVLADSVAARFLTKTAQLLTEQELAHVVLTGGSIGIGVLAAVNSSPARDAVDWSRVHFWWGDERWLPSSDSQRNDIQAKRALLEHIAVPPANVHSFASQDDGAELDSSAEAYAETLARYAVQGAELPKFDITFLGVGPDGHIASLFPDHDEIRVADRTVVSVHNSPKPPPQRLSLTLKAINSSERVWLVLAGADKASALGLALAGASRDEVPAAGAHGRHRTVFFVDQDAAAEVPEELISPGY